MSHDPAQRKDAVGRDRLVVALILVVGWTIAGALYVTSPAPSPEDPEIQEMEQSKKYEREIERIGGKAAVLTSQLNDWVASLWEGRARAGTTGVLTVLTAGGYVLARRLAR